MINYLYIACAQSDLEWTVWIQVPDPRAPDRYEHLWAGTGRTFRTALNQAIQFAEKGKNEAAR